MKTLSLLDEKIFFKFYQIAGLSHLFDKFLAFLAIYLIYLIPLILIILWFWSEDARRVAWKATMAGLIAWLVFCNLIGTIWSRARPFVAEANIREFIFHRPDRSFPSDHSAFLFALVFIFWFFGYKKLSFAIFLLAIVISVCRIIVGVHFPADVIAGFVLGFIAAVLVWVLRKPLDIIFEPMIRFFKKLRLA